MENEKNYWLLQEISRAVRRQLCDASNETNIDRLTKQEIARRKFSKKISRNLLSLYKKIKGRGQRAEDFFEMIIDYLLKNKRIEKAEKMTRGSWQDLDGFDWLVLHNGKRRYIDVKSPYRGFIPRPPWWRKNRDGKNVFIYTPDIFSILFSNDLEKEAEKFLSALSMN